MANTRQGAAAIEKAIGLFLRVVEGGETSLSALAADAGIPRSTAQRLAAAFVRQGLLSRPQRGRYGPGIRCAGIATALDTNAMLARASRLPLRRLAQELGATVHLGVLEGEMMTYLVKEHGGGRQVLTSERSQLEAYCSGIGKMLLATLDDAALDVYLDAGPFIALTPATITEPDALRAELRTVRGRGYAIDSAELEPGLYCLAVPLFGPGGQVLAAISVSGFSVLLTGVLPLAQLRACATRIACAFGG